MRVVKKLVLIHEASGQVEVWGRLTELCRSYPEFSYGYLSKQKFPFTYKGFMLVKIPYNTRIVGPFTVPSKVQSAAVTSFSPFEALKK